MAGSRTTRLWLPVLCVLIASASASPASEPDPGLVDGRVEFRSSHLGRTIVVEEGVFHPKEAERDVLPLMKKYARLFEGSRVLEIGTGSGLVSLYAAKLGSAHVVATDIDARAVETASGNAERLGLASVVEARLVPPDDISAYSVIRPDEQFDVIISNPPFALDLDAKENNAVTDKGDLGFSIVRGFATHLAPRGTGLLYYNSNFYHGAMVMFARQQGYRVRNHVPGRLAPWEAATLYNAYLARLLAHEGLEPGSFSFDWQDETAQLKDREVRERKREPLIGDGRPDSFPGWIAITRP